VQKSRVLPTLFCSNYFHKESTLWVDSQKGRLGRYYRIFHLIILNGTATMALQRICYSCLRPVKKSKNQECAFFLWKYVLFFHGKVQIRICSEPNADPKHRAEHGLVYYYSVVRRCNEGCFQFGRIRIFGWIWILHLIHMGQKVKDCFIVAASGWKRFSA
jgi:hypothetical protein